MIFDIEKIHFRDTCNPGGWLILQDLLKNGVAKGVASKINDFTQY